MVFFYFCFFFLQKILVLLNLFECNEKCKKKYFLNVRYVRIIYNFSLLDIRSGINLMFILNLNFEKKH